MISIPVTDPGLFLEYWNLPEETKKHVHDGWFFTGDYAKYDEDGYIWFMGRKDDIIKSFGYRVSPYEIERVYKSHPDITILIILCIIASKEPTIMDMFLGFFW